MSICLHSVKSPCDLGSLGDKMWHKKYSTKDLRQDVQKPYFQRRPTVKGFQRLQSPRPRKVRLEKKIQCYNTLGKQFK